MAEKKKNFDLAAELTAALKDVSNSDTAASGREQIEYIDIGRIKPDKRNFYALTGIEELAANIELCGGLQQPLRLRSDGEDYVISSGHRRHAALALLVREGKEQYRAVPCIVDKPEGQSSEVEDMLQELRLIFANSDTRQISGPDLAKQAERVETLFYQLKEAGMEFPGRMRDRVAAACKVSGPKLARLKVIKDKLTPQYYAEFIGKRLNESQAYALARLPDDFQKRLFRIFSGGAPDGQRLERILKKYEDGWRWEPCLTCPDGKECKRGDTFLRHDGECYGGEECGGKTCCLECPEAKGDYNICDRMCSKAKAQRKDKRDTDKAKAEREAEKRKTDAQKATQRNAQRLLRAIDAAGLGDDVTIHWSSWNRYKVKVIRQWAQGDFAYWMNGSCEELKAGSCEGAVNVAKLLHTTTDWVLGVTEELTPLVQDSTAPAPVESILEEPPVSLAETQVPEVNVDGGLQTPTAEGNAPLIALKWIDGCLHPDKSMQAVTKFDIGGDGGAMLRVAYWDDLIQRWRFSAQGEYIDAPILAWFPIPDDEEERK